MTPRPDGSRVSDYDYTLPPERIARYPVARRDASRLLTFRRGGHGPESQEAGFRHLHFSDLTRLVPPGDLLVVNESRVLAARLLGRKPTGASAEILLLRPADASRTGAPARGERSLRWEALVRPGTKLKPGRTVEVAPDLRVRILDSTPGGGRLVELDTALPVGLALARYGHMPLPPYLAREDEPSDRERYQTVYARVPGSVAAPTAGLHFTAALLEALAARGVRRSALTLHVGVGTFRPVEVDDPDAHEMHAEVFSIPTATARAVTEVRERGGHVWAVGTTVARALEAAADGGGGVRPGAGATDLFIHPPYEFGVVDALITNFHLPRSTLLMLVAAFAGYRPVMDAYARAMAGPYRFYSYGDAMAVLPRR